MRFTVLGASGFIGSHLVAHLRQQGHECLTPDRGDPAIFAEDLGHVLYCIGLTADFRRRPFDTARAHVCLLADVLEKARFDSLLYLSSTRIYGNSGEGREDAVLRADPRSFSDLYNLTKMTGEALCFATGRPTVRVARLSNVWGNDLQSDNFLVSIIRSALEKRRVTLHTTLDSSKDYVSVRDVAETLPRIALSGQGCLYNVASGVNVSNGELLERLTQLTGCTYAVMEDAAVTRFPVINIGLLREEFGFRPTPVLEGLNELVQQFRKASHDRQHQN